MLANFFLDLLFGVDRRFRERAIEIERARQEQIADARRRLMAELRESEAFRKEGGQQ
jgi:hypothetical protein